MTYAQLKEELNSFTDEELNQDVTVFDKGPEEFFKCSRLKENWDSDVLDLGHWYLSFNL